jgi:NADH-quinone oxidoreductase subunit L
MYFLVFHGKERMDEHTRHHLKESPLVVTVPLILLAIPSVVAGAAFVGSMAFGHFFGKAIFVLPQHDVLGHLAEEYHGPLSMVLHGFVAWPFWLALAGVGTAWFLYMKRPELPARIQAKSGWLYRILDNKYGFDQFNDWFFAGGGRGVGRLLWKLGDVKLIDGALVNGTARGVGRLAAVLRQVQSGYLYHYAFAMIVGLLVLFGFFVLR